MAQADVKLTLATIRVGILKIPVAIFTGVTSLSLNMALTDTSSGNEVEVRVSLTVTFSSVLRAGRVTVARWKYEQNR